MAGKGHASNFSIKTGQSAGKACNDNAESPDDLSENEVVAWLQYPLEDSFDKNYCSDLFGQWPSSVAKTPPTTGDAGTSRLSGIGNSTGTGSAGFEERVPPRPTSAEAALALGAGRAAGLIPHAGLEVFSKVRTSMQPPLGAPVSSLPRSFPAPPSFTQNVFGKSGLSTVSSSKLPPRIRNASSLSNKLPLQPTQGGLNTVHSASQTKATVRAETSPAGSCSNGLSSKYEQEKAHLRDRNALCGSTSVSTVSEQSYLPTFTGPRKASFAHLRASSSQPSIVSHITEEANLRAIDNPPDSSSRGLTLTAPVDVGTAERLASTDVDHERLEKKIGVFASCSGASLTNADPTAKEASSTGKHKLEHSDCRSEEAEGESAEAKDPPKRSSSKRHRAAEVHNLSERRRRNRINEKMKALQELIPNSNKTDKASVLDEAIEYLKMLQLQIQMVTMRSGMNLSPMMIPVGMPHLQMAQLAPVGLGVPVGHAGVGVGMGMGVGMDLSHGVAGRTFQSLPPTYSHFGIPWQQATTVDSQNISHSSSNAEFSLSEFSSFERVSPQPSEMHVDHQNNLLCYQLHQQQNQPQQDCFPGSSPSNAISDSSNEQVVHCSSIPVSEDVMHMLTELNGGCHG